jgi:hypothetical protein
MSRTCALCGQEYRGFHACQPSLPPSRGRDTPLPVPGRPAATVSPWFDDRDPARLADWLRLWLDNLAGLPPMRRIAHDISSAAARAHRVIDAPPDPAYYGPCPDCGRDIWQQRIHPDHQESTPVACQHRECSYAEPLAEHNRRILAGGENLWLPIGQLVSAIIEGGEIVTRDQIKGWVRRGGLAREKRQMPYWQGGRLYTREVDVYRLGDVRDRAREAAATRGLTRANA